MVEREINSLPPSSDSGGQAERRVPYSVEMHRKRMAQREGFFEKRIKWIAERFGSNQEDGDENKQEKPN